MSYILTAEYGQCIERFFAAEESMIRAEVAGDWQEYAAAAQERKEWADLSKRCPKFVQEDDRA